MDTAASCCASVCLDPIAVVTVPLDHRQQHQQQHRDSTRDAHKGPTELVSLLMRDKQEDLWSTEHGRCKGSIE